MTGRNNFEQGRLPERAERKTIAGMVVGQTGCTVPWAMLADPEGKLWIKADASVMSSPQGTSTLEFQRITTGVLVFDQTISDERYDPEELPVNIPLLQVFRSSETPPSQREQ